VSPLKKHDSDLSAKRKQKIQFAVFQTFTNLFWLNLQELNTISLLPFMLEFIRSYPLYIPFIILNIYVIYKVIQMVMGNDSGNRDDDQDGGISGNDDPDLDLPPGVSLPQKESSLTV